MVRKLIELAVQSGREMQSEQTQFVHAPTAATIPTHENMLFCLALLRTKTHEQMQEAKQLLDRLLYFQQCDKQLPNYGNFPVYLHEYPYCRDHYTAARLLHPLYWIYHEFHQVLGEQLLARLQRARELLAQFAMQVASQHKMPLWVQLKIGCAVGDLPSINKEERERLIAYRYCFQSWNDPALLGEMAAALQMEYPSLKNSSWADLWSHIEHSWQRECSCYIGIPLKNVQVGVQPEVTLYDYYLGLIGGTLSPRAAQTKRQTLQAALLYTTPDQLPEPNYPSTVPSTVPNHPHHVGGYIYQEQGFGFALQTNMMRGELHHLFSPFYLAAGEHTCTLDSPKGMITSYSYAAPHGELILDIEEGIFTGDKEKAIAFSLYFDDTPGVDVRVEEQKATTFLLGERVAIILPPVTLELKCELIEGEGIFMGHLQKGNRPSQIENKGLNRYTAYDWHVALRAVSTNSRCRIRLAFKIVA